MHIKGLQKLTLLDYPHTLACTLFLEGCPFRCPFCHNAHLLSCKASDDDIAVENFLAFLASRKGKLQGVVISGGEPLMQKDLSLLLRQIKSMGFRIKLDTNGAYPDHLATLLDEGLVDYVAMDIKHTPRNYALACGVKVDCDAIERSRSILMQGQVPYEFRTTLVKGIHKAGDVKDMASWLKGANAYILQNYRASDSVLCGEGLSSFSEEDMQAFLAEAQSEIPHATIRGVNS